MNAKKSLRFTIAIMMVVIPIVFSSCGRGDGDPALSFRSRKARVCGTWTVTNLQSEVIRKENNINTETTTTVDGDSWKQVIKIQGTDSVRTLQGKITKEPKQEEGSYYFTFDKNGNASMTYKYEYSEDISGEDDDVSTIITTMVTEEVTGKWNFLAGIDDYKNKERIALIIIDKKTTTNVYKSITSDDEGGIVTPTLLETNVANDRYGDGEYSTIYVMEELRSKEIRLRQDINTFYLRNANGRGESYQDNGFELLTLQPRK